MRRVLFGLALGFVLMNTGFAQMPTPQPAPENKALDYFLGTWTMEGEIKPSPFGPGGKMSGAETCERLGAFHLVCRSKGTGPMGSMEGVAIMSWDAASKAYTYYAANSMMPDAEFAKGVRKGRDWLWSSEANIGGQKIQSSFTVMEQGANAYGMKWETTAPGGGRTTIMEARATRK
jgi:hypothetical protein